VNKLAPNTIRTVPFLFEFLTNTSLILAWYVYLVIKLMVTMGKRALLFGIKNGIAYIASKVAFSVHLPVFAQLCLVFVGKRCT